MKPDDVTELLEEILVATRRSASYLAILAYLAVVVTILSIAGGVIGVVLASR